jgi:hypothetical protein
VSDRAAAIEEARAALAAREDGVLERPQRHAVLRALGVGDAGRAARARLARESVERVLPLWHEVRPGDAAPGEALALIDRVLTGAGGRSDVIRVAGDLWAEVDDAVAADDLPGLTVGYAASKALLAALDDEPLDPPEMDPPPTDDDVDFRRDDTAMFSASAAAGGAPWEPESDAGRRRAFWQWWLDRAAEV